MIIRPPVGKGVEAPRMNQELFLDAGSTQSYLGGIIVLDVF